MGNYVVIVYFVAGDRERLEHLRDAQASMAHPDERFMLGAPPPAYDRHRSLTAGPNVNSVLSAVAEHEGRRERLFFKPLSGVDQPNARGFDQNSLVDLGIHEVAAWWLARELGPPWSELVAPAVWYDPSGAIDIRECGSVSLGMGGSASLPEPGTGFDQLISDAAFFDALIGSQDRHDQNLRAAMPPPKLGLIDHGYAFARPGDYHNRFPTAGFFLQLRFGERSFAWGATALDYSGVGPLSPALAEHEQAAIARIEADRADLLGVAQILSEERADALRGRVDRMASAGEVLREGDF